MSLFSMERRISQGLQVDMATVLKSKRQVDRLTGLVSDLLDASRLERGKLMVTRAPLELGYLIVEVVEGFRTAAEHSFEVVLPRQKIWVLGDRDRLEQVVVNLLENAQKYSPSAEPIRIELLAHDSVAEIRVVDHGIGIPTAEQEHLFERFYRAQNASHRNFGGLGLGLFISRSILRLHEGELSVHSEEGQGAVFTVTLPKLAAGEVAKLPRRVLIVDGDPQQQAQARAALVADGFEVVVVSEPLQALKKLGQLFIDLVLVDAGIQENPGQMLRTALSSVPAIRAVPLLVGGSELAAWADADVPRCVRPYQADELTAAARRALELAGGAAVVAASA
jgi:two-component system, sensor histidine kinase